MRYPIMTLSPSRRMNLLRCNSLPSSFHGSSSRIQRSLHIFLGSNTCRLLHPVPHLSSPLSGFLQAVQLSLRRALQLLLKSSELIHGAFHGRFEVVLRLQFPFVFNTQRFDRIVYNFPHVGFHYSEDDHRQIKLNKKLVKGFFKNAKVLLRKQGGEIHVTHKKGYPYDKWNLVKKAEKIGLVLHAEVPFNRNDYPGYYNKRGQGSDCDGSFPIGHCSTYKFRLPPQFANWNGY